MDFGIFMSIIMAVAFIRWATQGERRRKQQLAEENARTLRALLQREED